MTEYEMAYLSNELVGTIANSSAMAFTTVSAFLTVGYLAAHKLSRFMIVTVIVIYTLWLSGAVSTIIRVQISLVGLAQQMALMANQGKGFQWHVVASNPPPQWYVQNLSGFTMFVFALTYIASVVFFLQLRRQNRKAEIGETPKV